MSAIRNKILKTEEQFEDIYRKIRERCDSDLWGDLCELRNANFEMTKIAKGLSK